MSGFFGLMASTRITSGNVIVSAGLVLNFDAGTISSYPGSGTTWTDTASSKTATLNTGVSYLSNYGGIMTFNGNSLAYATVNSFTSLSNNFSIECWYQATAYHPALWHSGSIGSSGFMMGYFSGSSPANSWKMTKYGVYDIYAGSIPQNANWHQVTYTYSSTTGLVVYVDGVSNGTYTSTSANTNLTTSTSNYIGWAESGYHSGNIGSLRMWNTVLSSTQVAQNFSAVRSKYGI